MLSRLELLGFKSFANRATFEFEPGISALVGPNGSGKSNVADAVRWVLGEQSARALRSRKAEEVIFVGSNGRHPLGMAEVALVLDNTGRRLPLDYQEVRLARRLYRSGESEYLLNGSRVRRKDLVGLLQQVGLHADGYTVIGQGAVDELVMQRPDERRAVLEHAADISRHQARLGEARAKLAAASQNLTRCHDLVAELEPHARRLRMQAQKAERYAALRAELAALARAYYPAALAEKTARHEAATDALARATAGCDQHEADIAALERERQRRREELTSLDAGLAERRAHLERLHRERDACLAELATARQRAGFLEARGEALAAEAERATGRIAELSAQASEAETEVEADRRGPSADRLQPLEIKVEKLAAELRRSRRSLDAARGDQAALTRERVDLERKAEAARERLARGRQITADATARRRSLEARLAENVRQRRRQERDLELSKQRERAAREALAAARLSHRAARERVALGREREQALRGDLQLARATLAAVLDDERDEADAVANNGPLHRLGSSLIVPPEYQAAVAAALGEWARAELVGDVADARAALVSETQGRALYLAQGRPSDRDRTLAERFRRAADSALGDLWCRRALDVVGPAANGSRAVPLWPLAFTLIVRDLGAATTVSDRLATAVEAPFQIATLGGQVVARPAGWARGAESQANRLVSLRRREADGRARLAELSSAMDVLARELAEADEELMAAESRERDLQGAEIAAQAETRLLIRRGAELLAEHRELAKRLCSLPQPRAESPPAESEAGFGLHRDQLARRAAELAEHEATSARSLQAVQAEWERAWAEREAVRREVELEAANRRARLEIQAARAGEIERLRGERDSAIDQADGLAEELAALRVRLEAANGTAAKLGGSLDETGRAVDALASRRLVHLAAYDGLDAQIGDLRRRLAEARTAREGALLARQQAFDELARLRSEAEATAEEWGIAGEGVVQLRLLGRAPGASDPADPSPEQEIDLAGARRRLLTLQRELRSQGAAGETVLEEYREVEGRLRFLNDQSADLRAAMQELEGVIEELEGLMRRGFTSAFERVNTAFEGTFSRLFGGGTARLVLTDPDDPLQTGVDIVAQPPGKRLQSLMSLSGGERALTSTALIFALLAINPLPFCVLDEVDAALDESNARRFADLLAEHATRIQFVIITHNRATMEIARALYGISMGDDGVTIVVSLRPAEALAHSRAQAENGSRPVLQA